MNLILAMFWSLKMLVNSKVFWSALSFSFFETFLKPVIVSHTTHGYKTSKNPLRSCISLISYPDLALFYTEKWAVGDLGTRLDRPLFTWRSGSANEIWAKILAFHPENFKWDQTLKFLTLSKTTSSYGCPPFRHVSVEMIGRHVVRRDYVVTNL